MSQNRENTPPLTLPSSKEIWGKPGGPEPIPPSQNTQIMGENPQLSLVKLDVENDVTEPNARSYALGSANAEVPPGRLIANSPRCVGSPHGRRGRFCENSDPPMFSSELPLVLVNQGLDFEIRGDGFTFKQPILNEEHMDAVYRAIMNSQVGQSSPHLMIGAPTINQSQMGHSELLAICYQGNDQHVENSRHDSPGTKEHEKDLNENHKKGYLGDEGGGESVPMDCDGFHENLEIHEENQLAYEGWDAWASNVDVQVGLLQEQVQGVQEAVQNTSVLMENFMQNVQMRVDGAMHDYKNAICHKFAEFGVQSDELCMNLHQGFQNAASEIQEKARVEVMQLFTAHALESGHLWQGLVKAQSDHLEEVVKVRVDTEKSAMAEFVCEKVLHTLQLELRNEMEMRLQKIKSENQSELQNELTDANKKMEEIIETQKVMEISVGKIRDEAIEIRENFDNRTRGLERGILLCLCECRKLGMVTSEAPSNLEIAAMREKILKVEHDLTSETRQKGKKEGKLSQKVESLEKRVEGVQQQVTSQNTRNPGIVVVPQTVVQVPVAPPTHEKTIEIMDSKEEVKILDLAPLFTEEPKPNVSVLGVQEAIMGCMSGVGGLPSGDENTSEIQIRPVELGTGTHHDAFGLLNLPIAAHLSRTQVAPKFSNKKEDWNNFMRKFDSWVRSISSGRILNDHESLQLLNSCLPENLQKEMQLWERERGRMPTYVEFRACLEAKFGRAQSENMRKRWMDVQMPRNPGKLVLQHFDEFRVNFRLALADVPDATPDEARRVLCDKLPSFMRRWVVEAEAKRMKTQPIVELVLWENLNVPSVKASVAKWVAHSPNRVDVRGEGMYLLHFSDERVAQKLLEMHGRNLLANSKKIQVRMVEQHLSLDDIFYEIHHQLETQEKTAEFQRRGGPTDFMIRKAGIKHEKNRKRDEVPELPPCASQVAHVPVPSHVQGPREDGARNGPSNVPNPPGNYREGGGNYPHPSYQGNRAAPYQYPRTTPSWENQWQNPKGGKGVSGKGFGGKGNLGGRGAKGVTKGTAKGGNYTDGNGVSKGGKGGSSFGILGRGTGATQTTPSQGAPQVQ